MTLIGIAFALSFVYATSHARDLICDDDLICGDDVNCQINSFECADDWLIPEGGGSLYCTSVGSCAGKTIKMSGGDSVTCGNDEACNGATIFTSGKSTLTCEDYPSSCLGTQVETTSQTKKWKVVCAAVGDDVFTRDARACAGLSLYATNDGSTFEIECAGSRSCDGTTIFYDGTDRSNFQITPEGCMNCPSYSTNCVVDGTRCPFWSGSDSAAAASIASDVAGNPMFVPSTDATPFMVSAGLSFVALMLACIAGLLCFAICVRPLLMITPAAGKHSFAESDLL